jgi:iron-sulfur cluster assembly accessory protein
VTSSPSEPKSDFSVTASAARRIAHILADDPGKAVLRISVSGGGCSGFQYGFTTEAAVGGDDLVIRQEKATVVIDPVSLEFVRGSTLDFVDDLMGQSFRVINPNATAACGCGTSFSIG